MEMSSIVICQGVQYHSRAQIHLESDECDIYMSPKSNSLIQVNHLKVKGNLQPEVPKMHRKLNRQLVPGAEPEVEPEVNLPLMI